MYRAFRGAEPDNRAMLEARGLLNESLEILDDSLFIEEIIRVDTRAQARQRAERSRREREQARLKAEMDSLALDTISAPATLPAPRTLPKRELPKPDERITRPSRE